MPITIILMKFFPSFVAATAIMAALTAAASFLWQDAAAAPPVKRVCCRHQNQWKHQEKRMILR